MPNCSGIPVLNLSAEGENAVRIQLVIMWVVLMITLSWQASCVFNICCGPSSNHKSSSHQHHVTTVVGYMLFYPLRRYKISMSTCNANTLNLCLEWVYGMGIQCITQYQPHKRGCNVCEYTFFFSSALHKYEDLVLLLWVKTSIV